MNTIKDFRERINKVVDHYLGDFVPAKTSDKVIHDPIWGSVVYYRWEIELIDTPLFQRLRDIHQLGMAEYTYPAARHSRYEHSLGTVAIATKMLQRLRSRYNTGKKADAEHKERYISDKDVYTVRLAALLHDIGHCVFSHLSEEVYGVMPEMKAMIEFLKEDSNQNISPKPHETLSYLIMTSDSFIDFFKNHISFPKKGTRAACKKLLTEAANMVVGISNYTRVGEKVVFRSFLTGIINSDFDADKLDYTQRDSYTAGIALTYGVERFLMKLVIHTQEERSFTDHRLAVTEDALLTVEELIFNRNILYVYIYYHQKVLATEDVMQDCIQGLLTSGRIKHPCDFLYLSDRDVELLCNDKDIPYPQDAPNKSFADIADMLKTRNIPKRCLVLDRHDFETDVSELDAQINGLIDQIQETSKENAAHLIKKFGEDYGKMLSSASAPGAIKKLISAFNRKTMDKYFEIRRQWLDLILKAYEEKGLEAPDIDIFDLNIVMPRLKDSHLSLLVVSKTGEAFQKDTFAYINNWSDSFNVDKWKGYFFVSSKVDRTIAAETARELIKIRRSYQDQAGLIQPLLWS